MDIHMKCYISSSRSEFEPVGEYVYISFFPKHIQNFSLHQMSAYYGVIHAPRHSLTGNGGPLVEKIIIRPFEAYHRGG
jgi:hypothetical protein